MQLLEEHEMAELSEEQKNLIRRTVQNANLHPILKYKFSKPLNARELLFLARKLRREGSEEEKAFAIRMEDVVNNLDPPPRFAPNELQSELVKDAEARAKTHAEAMKNSSAQNTPLSELQKQGFFTSNSAKPKQS